MKGNFFPQEFIQCQLMNEIPLGLFLFKRLYIDFEHDNDFGSFINIFPNSFSKRN
jgi:hypothetical protein